MSLKTEFADYALHELERSPATVHQYLWRFGYLERHTGKPIEQVTADDLRRLKRTSPLASGSVKGLIVAARAFHSWGALEGHWTLNGISLVRTPREVNYCSPPLSVAEVRAIKQACLAPLDYRLVYLGLYAGMRIGESARFESKMWHPGFLRFRSQKSGTLVEVPVHSDLLTVRSHILASPTVHTGTLQKVKEQIAARSGVDFVAHQLRKSFSSTLYDRDVPDEIVENLLGHVGSVTRRYAPVSRLKRERAIRRLSY